MLNYIFGSLCLVPCEWVLTNFDLQSIALAFEHCVLRVVTTCADFVIFKETSCRGNFEMSCEPGRKSAYSSDLRYRMVWQRIAMKLESCT